MPIEYLDHVNLRTAQMNAMIAWYEDILGLTKGPRPPSSSKGAWMYAGERAVVHLVDVDDPPGAGSEAPLKLEHFAFAATDYSAFEAALQSRGERFSRNDIAAAGIIQTNLWDLDGNHIHVDFPMDE